MAVEVSLLVVVLLLIGCIAALYIYSKQREKVFVQTISEINQQLTSEKNKSKTVTYSFGKIDKYTEEDTNLLRSNPQLLQTIIKILSNFTILRNDSLRNPANSDRIKEVIGECNAFNETIFFFYKLTLTPEQLDNMSK